MTGSRSASSSTTPASVARVSVTVRMFVSYALASIPRMRARCCERTRQALVRRAKSDSGRKQARPWWAVPLAVHRLRRTLLRPATAVPAGPSRHLTRAGHVLSMMVVACALRGDGLLHHAVSLSQTVLPGSESAFGALSWTGLLWWTRKPPVLGVRKDYFGSSQQADVLRRLLTGGIYGKPDRSWMTFCVIAACSQNFRRLAAMLEVAEDPDFEFLREFASVGATLGVDVLMPRTPAVGRWRRACSAVRLWLCLKRRSCGSMAAIWL